MRVRVAFCAAALTVLCVVSETHAQRLIFLVRHAQRNQDDSSATSPLTAQGRAQAEQLAFILKDAGVTAIYTTQFERTKQTAQKLKDLLTDEGVSVRESSIPLSDALLSNSEDHQELAVYAKSVVERLSSEAASDIVLVVGHDLTIPAIIKALGCKSTGKIDRDDFTNMYVVVPRKQGSEPVGLLHIPNYMQLRAESGELSGDSGTGAKAASQ